MRSLARGSALRAFSACVLAFSLVSPASAAGPGTSAAPFLRIGFGARALGMGEAYVASATDASALHYNPAGIAGRNGDLPWEVLVSHAFHFQEIGISQLGLVRRPWGVALTYLTVPGLERRTAETARPEGTFGATDMALSLSRGGRIGSVAVGGTFRVIRQTLDQHSAAAFAVDAGAMFSVPGRPVRLGASIVNVGSKVRFIDKAFPLPTTVKLGVAAGNTLAFPVGVSAQVDFPRDSDPLYRLGVEYSGFGPISLRAGYLAAPRVQREALLGNALGGVPSGLTEFFGYFAGFGFRYGRGSIDYALLPYGELGNSHRFSLGLKF